MLGKHEDAIKCYDTALKQDPLNADTWFNKGMALKAAGRDAEGNTCCNYAVSLYLGK
jgi:tetratricopeptide (TPR) repeat protein